MANEEQLAILKQGVEVWNKWRAEHITVQVDLINADLKQANLRVANLERANLLHADLRGAYLSRAALNGADLWRADLRQAKLWGADLSGAFLTEAKFIGANLSGTNLFFADLKEADLTEADLRDTNLKGTSLKRTVLSQATVGGAVFSHVDLAPTIGLEEVHHEYPSTIGTDTLRLSQGKIPDIFLRGCGLSDWEIEAAKLYNPDLSNDEFIDIQNGIFNLRQRQALQISPLFISYSHGDTEFVDKLGKCLQDKGVRYWRDIHEMKAGKKETQIDRGIRQNPTVLLVLSENSLNSDQVQHEVRRARELEKELERDVLCPVALDNSWKSSRWPKRIMEQIMEYNILDFSEWKDDSKFERMFRKLIDGLELFYKG